MLKPNERYMREAIQEALVAKKNGDYAIGAIIVNSENNIIARSPNISRSLNDPTRHAELEVIRIAIAILGKRFLDDCVLYTTHEPCPMCATAAVWARLGGVVYGARLSDMIEYAAINRNEKWIWRTVNIPVADLMRVSDPQIEIVGDVLRGECKKLFHC